MSDAAEPAEPMTQLAESAAQTRELFTAYLDAGIQPCRSAADHHGDPVGPVSSAAAMSGLMISADRSTWSTDDEGRGLYLADAGPQMWLPWQVLDDLIRCMPLFPVALVSTDFTGCPKGHYEPGDGSVGAILRFRLLADGRRLVYRIVHSDRPTMTYECAWPD